MSTARSVLTPIMMCDIRAPSPALTVRGLARALKVHSGGLPAFEQERQASAPVRYPIAEIAESTDSSAEVVSAGSCGANAAVSPANSEKSAAG